MSAADTDAATVTTAAPGGGWTGTTGDGPAWAPTSGAGGRSTTPLPASLPSAPLPGGAGSGSGSLNGVAQGAAGGLFLALLALLLLPALRWLLNQQLQFFWRTTSLVALLERPG
jgi:hypothetical protein